MQNNDSNNFAKIITIVATFVIILGSYFLLIESPPSKQKTDDNITQNEVDIGGNFALINHRNIVESTTQFREQYKLVYFGFTYCPDICPTALSTMSNVIDILENNNIAIKPIFVTIDPKRDTTEVLKSYVSHFHQKIVGYTGPAEEVKKVAHKFKVFYAIAPRDDAGPEDYLMDHSSFIYFMSKNMKFLKHFSSNESPENIAHYIQSYIASHK